MGLVNLVDRVGELAPSPVLKPVDRAAVRLDHRTIPLDHGGDLLALVRMDQEHHFVVPHRSLLAGLPPEHVGTVRQGVWWKLPGGPRRVAAHGMEFARILQYRGITRRPSADAPLRTGTRPPPPKR